MPKCQMFVSIAQVMYSSVYANISRYSFDNRTFHAVLSWIENSLSNTNASELTVLTAFSVLGFLFRLKNSSVGKNSLCEALGLIAKNFIFSSNLQIQYQSLVCIWIYSFDQDMLHHMEK